MQHKKYQHIYFDWHGVLGTKGFWFRSSQQNSEIERFTNYVFTSPETINAWMRGDVTLQDLYIQSDLTVPLNTLVSAFRKDWTDLEEVVNIALVRQVQTLFPETLFSLVTDNMDVFSFFLSDHPDLTNLFEKIYISSTAQTLKGDRPGLFEYILDDLQLNSFVDMLLLDDSSGNCQRFRELGGDAIQIKEGLMS